jgi:carbonic anhydrase
MHFHAPSEHTFDGGQHYDLELHIVHKVYDANNRTILGVICVYFDVAAGGNTHNYFLEDFMFNVAGNPADISTPVVLLR